MAGSGPGTGIGVAAEKPVMEQTRGRGPDRKDGPSRKDGRPRQERWRPREEI